MPIPRLLLVAGVTASFCTASLCTLAAPAQAAMRWGINPGMAQSVEHVTSPYGQETVRQMAAIGLREARYPAPWYIADPDGRADRPGGSYVWSSYFDSVATILAKNGIRWNPMFLYAPAIYSADPGGVSGGNPTRASYPHFANFARAFARRYGQGGSFWRAHPTLRALPVTDYEIWNEPNIVGGWATPETAPQDYMDLYAAAHSAIKGIDSGARVMFASLTPSLGAVDESRFLAAAVAHRPGQPIDEVGYHPNTIGIGTYGAVDHVYRLLRPFRARMDALGLQNVPISVTELAWGSEYKIFPDSWVTLTEAERAKAMRTVGSVLANSDCNINMVGMLFWGTDRPVSSYDEDPERYVPTVFAIANPNNSLKPIGEAYRDVIAGSSRARPAAICHSPSDSTRLVLSRLRLTPRSLPASRSRRSRAARKRTRISYRLSKAATVKFRIGRAYRGRRTRGRCTRPRRSNRTAPRCTRYVLLAGGFTHRGRAGSNSFRFSGRLNGRLLKPGRYRLRGVAADAAQSSASKRRRFKVVR